MSEKHYDISYLENTSRTLKGIKEISYQPFKTLNQGIVIDLGCGTGADVINMSALVQDNVKIVGIDHDAAMINEARKSSGNKKNIEFIVSEAYPLPYKNESIAGIRTERMMQHLSEPQKVIQEIHRIMLKNSPLVIIETDWRSLSVYSGHHEIEKKINDYLTSIKVKNGLAARTITSDLRTLGFTNIQIEIFPLVLKSLKAANDNLWMERILDEAAEGNFITQPECELFKNSLRLADENNYFICSLNLVMVTAVK